MRADARGLLEHADVEVRLELLQANGAGETGRPGADDDDVVFHHLAIGHFGDIRIAPSRRMHSPLSIVFSQMCATSAAYSSGRPRRGGNGTCLPRESCTSCDSAATCLLYTSDAADERSSVDLGG